MIYFQVVPAWLNCLPIKSDLIEAKAVHDQLCSMVERQVDRYLIWFIEKVIFVYLQIILVTFFNLFSNCMIFPPAGQIWSFWVPIINICLKLFQFLLRLDPYPFT